MVPAMSGFWHPGEDENMEKPAFDPKKPFWGKNELEMLELDRNLEHSVLGYPREAVLYFLAAWDQHWGVQEQIRVRYGCPPWVALLSPARRAELGITTGHPFLDGHDALRPLLDS